MPLKIMKRMRLNNKEIQINMGVTRRERYKPNRPHNYQWKRFLQGVRVKHRADVWSDYHLVTANIKLKLMKLAPKSIMRRIDTGELKNRYQVL